jgi:hypothetical protein
VRVVAVRIHAHTQTWARTRTYFFAQQAAQRERGHTGNPLTVTLRDFDDRKSVCICMYVCMYVCVYVCVCGGCSCMCAYARLLFSV